MKLPLYFVFLLVGFSTAFIPTNRLTFGSGSWSSLNHKIITQAGLWCSVIDFLKTNPKYANQERAAELLSVDTARILEGKVSRRLFRLVRSSKFDDAVKEIENANAIVDKNEEKISAAHFDAEQFRKSSLRLLRLKKQIIYLITNAGDNKVDYIKARKEAGRLLHTLQDFYSHSNWIESGNSDPLSILGNEIISDNYVAGANEKTCNDCSPARRYDDCQNNLLNTGKLTSGYFGGQDVAKPRGVGKCSHGGIFDKSRKLKFKGGINKDSSLRYLSPHYRQHQPAARVAIKATKLFFDGIRKDVGDGKFAKFLDMEALQTLSFAIDTTGSMSDEIAGVQQATVQFIEDAAANNHQNFHYVLVPFNDPDVGPVSTTDDPEVAKQTVNSLRAHAGGDCPEMGMSGLYLALLNSLPNSDVYYFTDAAAKDAHLVFSVISIALQRKCRINLFVSGKCGSRRRRSLTEREVYEKLASATGGQLIEYSKSNIDEAIKLIRPANISEGNSSLSEEVSLLSVEVNTHNLITKSYSVQSDSTIASITAVLSAGGNTNIKVVPPQGGNGTINIISQTATFYSVRVIMPTAGVWKFTITATGPLTFQIKAQSTLAFITSLEKEEYSSTFEKLLVPISGNPIKGTSLYVTVEPTEDELQANRNITGYLIDTAGNRLESFELQQGQEFYSNSYFGLVKMNHDAFKIMYFGYSKNGETIQRLLSRVIRPQEFEVEISVQNNSLSLTPNETTSIIVLLKNHGSSNTFSILVSDDKSFVASFSPKIVTVGSNDSVDIHIDFFAPANTSDSTTTSVSVSASIQFASTVDLANFLSFEVSVFSKEFRFINETEVTSKLNISSFLDESANLTICQQKLDLGFILDSSGSVGQRNFERMKSFVKDLTDFYKLGPEETRVSVISYSNSANIHIAFSAYFSDKNRFDSAVDRISYTGGGTATAMALNMAYNYMFTSHYGARGSEFKKVLVILTDGQSNTRQVSGPARQLKNAGVVIFSVGIGQSLSMHELRVMASDPVNQRVITLDNFSQLDRLAEQMSSQTCNASNFHVFCDNDHMTAVFERAGLPKHVNIDRLHLRSRHCRADWNSTHVIVKTSLTGCGTAFSKNDQTLFFSNVLSEEGNSGRLGVITRDYLFKANLTCAYPRKRTVGSFSFAPAKQRVFVNVGGQGNFTLIMDVFKSIDYRQPYASQDYPVFKSLSDNLYIQYSINTSNPNLVVRAETCRATPTNRPYDTPQYVFIADGCDKDETIRHYSYGMSSVQRFSMQAFRFLTEHRFVYLHCDLVVCHRYDYNSTCARSTSCSKRYRRDVDQQSQDVSGMYALSFGPIMEGKESDEKSAGAHSEASNATLIGSLIGFGCLSVVLIGALLFVIQRSRRRRSDQTQNGVANKGALSMQNLGYT